ncbi:MAG: hypothetical protein AAF618_02660 [Pseudomonadota bacterium]
MTIRIALKPAMTATLSLAAILMFVSVAAAQTVAVLNGREAGHGWMFRHEGACFLILPRHVAEPPARMTLRTEAPVATGRAVARTPFWPGIDLAIATVDANLLPRCTGDLDTLIWPQELRATRTARLERLTFAGELERVPLTLGDRTYLQFTGTVPEGERIAQGTSGSFAFARGRPLGMSVTSSGEREATFIRGDEIRIHVARWLEEHAQPFAAASETRPAQGARTPLPLTFVESSAPPIAAEYAGDNMLHDGSIFVAAPRGALSLRFQVGDGSAALPLSQVTIEAAAGTGFAQPRQVLIYFSPRRDGTSRRLFARGEIGLDGQFETPIQAPRNARWLELVVTNAWAEGPVGIAAVRAY